MNDLPFHLAIVKDACISNGYKFKIIDRHSNLLARVNNGSNFVIVENQIYPINNYASVSLVDDKTFSKIVLNEHDIKTPEGDVFFVSNGEYLLRSHNRNKYLKRDGKELKDAIAYAKKLGFPLFVKPNSGTMGHLAMSIGDENELVAHLKAIAEYYPRAIIEKEIQCSEHRVFVLDGKVIFSYQRKQPVKINGDGKHSFNELVDLVYQDYPDAKELSNIDNEYVDKQLASYGLTRTSILPGGNAIQLWLNANLHAGGYIEDFRQEVSDECRVWAAGVAKAFGLKVCGIDVFAPNDMDDNPENYIVTEVNGNPYLETISRFGYYDLAVQIWEEVLDIYFRSRK